MIYQRMMIYRLAFELGKEITEEEKSVVYSLENKTIRPLCAPTKGHCLPWDRIFTMTTDNNSDSEHFSTLNFTAKKEKGYLVMQFPPVMEEDIKAYFKDKDDGE